MLLIFRCISPKPFLSFKVSGLFRGVGSLEYGLSVILVVKIVIGAVF